MIIQTGQTIPEGQLIECEEFDPTSGCPTNPKTLSAVEEAEGKVVVIFGVPGAFTPTCSQRHLPGFVSEFSTLKSRGVDEIWCLSVNDHFVMAEWGRALGASGKIRMMADGSAVYVKKLGLDRDLTANGMGVRARRFAMILRDGKVAYIGVEESGQFEVSSAEAILANL